MPNETSYEAEMTAVLEIWNNLMVKQSNGYPLTPEEIRIKASLANLIRSRAFFLGKLFDGEGRRLDDDGSSGQSGQSTDEQPTKSPEHHRDEGVQEGLSGG